MGRLRQGLWGTPAFMLKGPGGGPVKLFTRGEVDIITLPLLGGTARSWSKDALRTHLPWAGPSSSTTVPRARGLPHCV